jgi:hypothetical protein
VATFPLLPATTPKSRQSRTIPLTALLLLAASAVSPGAVQTPTPVVLIGRTYVNQGLVGVGRIPATTRDSFGETFGSFSAFAFLPGSRVRNNDGSYSGILHTQPDRGYNVANTTNHIPRFNRLAVTCQRDHRDE